MGMSASQARLIALTARMNDIEYQGQQINQQRTTLSNQVNALYNQLLEMSVPTPPSTSDYTKVQYSGVSDASKFTLGNVVPTGKNDAGDSTYTVQFNYKRSGNSVTKSTTTSNVQTTPEKIGIKSAADTVKTKWLNTTSTHKAEGNALTSTENMDKDAEVLIKLDSATEGLDFNKYTVYDANGTKLTKKPDSGDVYVSCKVSDLSKEAYKGFANFEKDKENVYESGSKTEFNSAFGDNTDISSYGLYKVGANNSLEPITTIKELKDVIGDNCDTSKVFKLDPDASDKSYDNPNLKEGSTGMSVGTMPVYTLSEAKSKLGTSYEEYVKALQNAFPDEFESDADLDTIADKFYVYIENKNGTNVPHFIKKEELSQFNNDTKVVTPYDYVADGTYTQTDTKKECQLEFDVTTGRITKVGIPDGKGQVSWISVTAETVTDEDAYADAFNDYEYQKTVYDKKQQEINAKTSIVQQQDKNLELKLTRLDNERNAVNTEMEAVKKVVSDNIEKSYKTFSG